MPEPDLKTKAVIGLFLPSSRSLSLLWGLTANSSYSLMGACFPTEGVLQAWACAQRWTNTSEGLFNQ